MSPERRPSARDAEEYAVRVLLANRVREAREHAEMSVRQLAEAIGRPHSYVVDIENHHRRIAVSELWAIARATRSRVEDFVVPPRDEHEREEFDWAVAQYTDGGAPPPRPRGGRDRREGVDED